jgi:hypothetical protein
VVVRTAQTSARMPVRFFVYSSLDSTDADAPLELMEAIVWPARHACLSNLAKRRGVSFF